MEEAFAHALGQARRKLQGPPRADRQPMAALAAAAFFALAALTFAACAVMAPPLEHTPAARSGVK